MFKFKVGDKIKVVNTTFVDVVFIRLKEGDFGYIINGDDSDNNTLYTVAMDNGRKAFLYSEQMDLVFRSEY